MSMPPRRRRARTACIARQARKRKCSGTQPCTTCSRLKTECRYGQPVHQGALSSGKFGSIKSIPELMPQETIRTSIPNMHQSSVEANSGVASVRRLGSNIDPTFTQGSNVLVWNVGLRPFSPSMIPLREPIPISDIISQSEM